jgi:hypothetical protein
VSDQVAQRTACKKRTLEPVWDETLSFECQAGLSVLHVEMFDQVCCEIAGVLVH